MDRASDTSAPPGAIEDFFRLLLQGEPSVEYQHELRAPYTEMLRQKLLKALLKKKPPSRAEWLFGSERAKTAGEAEDF